MGLNVGLHFGVSIQKNIISAYNGTAKYLKSQIDPALMPLNVLDQTIYNRTSIDRELSLLVDQVYLHYPASQAKLRITK